MVKKNNIVNIEYYYLLLYAVYIMHSQFHIAFDAICYFDWQRISKHLMEGHDGEFKFVEPEKVAKLWGHGFW